jgi:hypothetical protein
MTRRGIFPLVHRGVTCLATMRIPPQTCPFSSLSTSQLGDQVAPDASETASRPTPCACTLPCSRAEPPRDRARTRLASCSSRYTLLSETCGRVTVDVDVDALSWLDQILFQRVFTCRICPEELSLVGALHTKGTCVVARPTYRRRVGLERQATPHVRALHRRRRQRRQSRVSRHVYRYMRTDVDDAGAFLRRSD